MLDSMELLYPRDKIQIVAPARKISLQELNPTINLLESNGFEVVYSDLLFGEYNQFSGTDNQRIKDLQSALDNPSIKAIWAARGGYGTMRIIDKLDFSKFIQFPKWICGYSDVTVLHSFVNNHLHLPSLHCTMPINITDTNWNETSVQTTMQILTTGSIDYQIEPYEFNRKGECIAEIIGGNLSILYAINGSSSDIDTKDKILFIEDLDEYLYHIDRMMLNLKRSGKLAHLSGLIVGGMSDMHDNTIPFGKSAYEIILEHVAEYNYPICFNFPAGHIADNRAIILGTKAHLKVVDDMVTLNLNR